MDHPEVDPHALGDALDHVAAVNRWLGGRRALLRHLPEALGAASVPVTPGSESRALRVLDVGTGSGDLPVAISHWARERGLRLELTGIDLHEHTLRVAAERTARDPIHLARANGLALPFETGTFHVALLSMTLHHMDEPDLVPALRELGRAARGGCVLVAELERCMPNYLGAKVLAATLWRRNPVTRHDGPLSVLRAFTTDELLELATAAGLEAPRVHRHPFFRLVLRADA